MVNTAADRAGRPIQDRLHGVSSAERQARYTSYIRQPRQNPSQRSRLEAPLLAGRRAGAAKPQFNDLRPALGRLVREHGTGIMARGSCAGLSPRGESSKKIENSPRGAVMPRALLASCAEPGAPGRRSSHLLQSPVSGCQESCGR
jgi:hypothetical protein